MGARFCFQAGKHTGKKTGTPAACLTVGKQGRKPGQASTYTTAVQKAVQKAIMPSAVQPNGMVFDEGEPAGPPSSWRCRLAWRPRAGEGTEAAVLASATATGTSTTSVAV